MKKIKKIYLLFPSLIMLTILSMTKLYADDPEFKASAPSVVIMGRPFNFTITANANVRGTAQLPDVEGVRLVGGPSTFISTQSSYVNGKMENVSTVTYTYSLIATKEGNITFPPVVVRVGNKSYNTNPLVIIVTPDQSSATQPGTTQPQASPDVENYYIRLLPSKRSVYLGEQFLVEAKIFTGERLRFSDMKYPEFEGFWKHELESEQQANREIINGKEFLTQVFKRDLLLPQKSGTLKVDPAETTVLVQKRVRSQRRNIFGDLFDDPFFDSYENIPVVLKSNSLNIEVKPLPAGAPAGFDGAVGQFTLDFSTDRQNTKVNEAITLKLSLRGKGNLSLITAPKIAFPPDVEVFEPKTSRNITHTLSGSSGSVTFEYVIIPRYAGKFRIPPIEFAFFDPVKKVYQGLNTAETNITVEMTDDSGQAAISGGQPLMPGVLRERVNNLNTDILFIKTNKPAWRKSDMNIAGTLLYKLMLPGGIFAYFLMVFLYRKRIKQNSDLAYTRNRKARKKAERRLRAARKLLGVNDKRMYEEILKSLWDYLSDKLNVPRSELSRKSIEENLTKYNLSNELMADLWSIIDECELAGYATGASSEPFEVYSKSEDLIYKFEQMLK